MAFPLAEPILILAVVVHKGKPSEMEDLRHNEQLSQQIPSRNLICQVLRFHQTCPMAQTTISGTGMAQWEEEWCLTRIYSGLKCVKEPCRL